MSTGKISGGLIPLTPPKFRDFIPNSVKSVKLDQKMLQISEKVPHKYCKFGIFMEFYYFSLENVPIFSFFPCKGGRGAPPLLTPLDRASVCSRNSDHRQLGSDQAVRWASDIVNFNMAKLYRAD